MKKEKPVLSLTDMCLQPAPTAAELHAQSRWSLRAAKCLVIA